MIISAAPEIIALPLNTGLAHDRNHTEEYMHNKESNMYRPFTILFFILLTLAALAEMGYLTLG